jgi:murein DD-endopeptidase MepM/ murein hydrolase activator NlpD
MKCRGVLCPLVVVSLLALAAFTGTAWAEPAAQMPAWNAGDSSVAAGVLAQVVDRHPHRSLRRTSAASKLIPPGGGTITWPGVVSVGFPPGTFPVAQQASIEKTSSPGTAEAFVDTAAIFQPGATLGYEIRIITGPDAPQTALQVTLALPPDFAVGADSRVEVLAQFWEQDELETYDNFELVPSSYDPLSQTVTVTLPAGAFTSLRRTDGLFEAILTLAATPGAATSPGLLSLAAETSTILPPVAQPQVRSAFDPNRKVTVDGVVYTGHWGTDFIATDGTPIHATGDGTVLRAYFSGDKSFGNSVLLKMARAGVARYAHLQAFTVQDGDKVLAGQEIGLTDNTGLSTGPHLHFELAPDGRYGSNKAKVDPAPLIEDRQLTWHLSAHTVYEQHSLIPGQLADYRLQMAAEVDFLAESDGFYAMKMSVLNGTLLVQSYTGGWGPADQPCTYSFVPQSYPVKVLDSYSIPALGDTVGSLSLNRDFSQTPSSWYNIYGGFYTFVLPEYTETCPGQSPKTQPIALATFPWSGFPAVSLLDPEQRAATGLTTVDGSNSVATHTSTYDWTLTKTY